MKLVKEVDRILKNKLLPAWLYLAGLLAVITTPSRLTDHTHEIQIIGNAWFHGGSIPLAQAYSNFLPVNLYVGALYERFITNEFTVRIFEIAIYSLIAGILYAWVRAMHTKRLPYQNGLLITALLIITIPGVWQVGVNPAKLGLLFLLTMYYSYDQWQRSSKSYWLFGETRHNSRWLLLAGVSLSMLLFTSLLLTLFALPIFINFFKIVLKDWAYGARQALIFFIPIFLQGWVWYSYFASRQLLTEAMRAAGLDVVLALRGAYFDPVSTAIVIFPVAIVLVYGLMAVRRDNFKLDRKTWYIGLAITAALAFSWSGILLTLPFIFTLAVPLFLKKLKLSLCVLWCTLGLVLVLPYRYLDASSSELAKTEAQIAESYVEQRLVDSNYVLYYGRGAGFFKESNFVGSSRFYNSAIFPFDTDTLGLVDKFRGDNEANTPLFVVYATNNASKAGNVPRIEAYFERHYEKVADLDGYTILKRK